MTTPTQTVKMIPFNSIFVDEEKNARTDFRNIDKLAENIKEHGLIEPLIVTNGGKGDKPYILHIGYRRAAALKKLKYGEKEVPVVLRDEWNPLIVLAENMHREGLNPLDTAQYVWGLFNGQYATPEGVEARNHNDTEIAQAINMSESSARNYRRVHEKLSGDVRKLVRKHHDTPLRLLIECISYGTDEVEVDEATGQKTKNWVPDDAKQLKTFNAWLEKKTKLEEMGQTRSPRGSKESEGGEAGSTSGDGSTYKRKPAVVLEAAVKIFNRKKAEDPQFGLYAQALRYASGEIDKLPGLAKAELEEEVKKMRGAARGKASAET